MNKLRFEVKVVDKIKLMENITPLEILDNWLPSFIEVIYQDRKIDRLLGIEKIEMSNEMKEYLDEADKRIKLRLIQRAKSNLK